MYRRINLQSPLCGHGVSIFKCGTYCGCGRLHTRLEFLSLELASNSVGRSFKMDLNVVVLISSSVVLVLSIIYWRIKKAYGFFTKQGITGPEPVFPLGTWTKSARTSIGAEDKQAISQHGPLVGTFDGLTPNLVIADLESIKKILTTDAAKFRARRAVETRNKILKNVLLILSNDCQQDSSSVLNTPINRKKINKLFARVEASANEFTRDLVKSRHENILSTNDAVSDFAHDATALVLLGVDLNADPVYRQAFIRNCENLFPGIDCSSALAIIPYLYGNIDNAITTKNTIEYFTKLITIQVTERLKQQDVDHASKAVDFIDILLEIAKDEEKTARKEKEQDNVDDSLILTKQVVLDQILAAVFTFNYWMRNTLVLAVNALARNSDVQEKLWEEIKQNLGNEKLNGEIVGKLPYLNGFVKEVQRMYPVEARLEKIATEDADLSETLKLKKGTIISIPVYALHTSKQFHSDPKTFNPNRFLSETDNPFIPTPSNAALSTQLSTMAIKTSIIKIVNKLKFSTIGEDAEDIETGAAFVAALPEIRVVAEIRE